MNLDRLKRWHWGAGAFVSALMVFVACDGQNLFDNDTNPFIDPRITALSVPDGGSAGDTIGIAISATAPSDLASIHVVLRGAVQKDTTITVTGRAASAVVKVGLPAILTDTLIFVSASATDKSGNVSKVRTDTARVRLSTGAPVIVSVTAPDTVRGGQRVDIRVVARGPRPITQITLRFRGAVDKDTIIQVARLTDVTVDGSITLPLVVSDTVLTVTAIATDVLPSLSAITAASVKRIRVMDVTLPEVTATVNPTGISAGRVVAIRVSARDNVGLTQIGFAVVNPAGDTIGSAPTLVRTSGVVKDTTFSFLVPLTITPRTIRVLGIGVDATGRRGLSTPVSVIVADSAAPTITVIAPAPGSTLPLNDSVRVQVRVQDSTGIKTIRLSGESVRVDSLGPTRTIQRFTESVITLPAVPGAPLPRDTTIIRYLKAVADSISETVNIIVTATDSVGNTAVKTTSILVGGPRVELRNPTNNAQVVPGGTLLLTAFAIDRTAGIDSVRFNVSGAQTATFTFRSGCVPATCQPNGLVSNDSVLINQNYVVGPATGNVVISATAFNRNRVAGQSAPVTVVVSTNVVSDAVPPQVRIAMTANDRVELTDTITVTVAAQDVGAAGLRRIGIVAIVTPGGTSVAPDTLYRDSVFAGSGRTGLQPATFKFTLKDFGYTEVNLIRLPRTMTFNVHAFARDTVGNTGCNVTNTLAALPCDSILPPAVPAGQKFFIAKNTPGLSQLVTVVPGFARALPSQGSVIADLIVDNNAARPRMYLSNQNFNRVEVLNLQDSTFAPSVSVGSEPWGMTLNNPAVGIGAGAPRLLVANSGGTNISQVDITQPVNAITEVAAERILTPNAVLFDVFTGVANGFTRYTTAAHDFSDRPQFIGQDANGIVLYSTKPTGAAPDGTVRYLLNTAPRREAKILFNRNAIISTADATAIAHVDSIIVQRNSTINDLINIFDHVPGNPTAIIQSGFQPLQNAIVTVRGLGSDIADFGGSFNLAVVGLSDTTFVTTSGDRQFVGFGEGGTGPFARVWLWSAATQGISDDVSVTDLVGNSAERVLGIALNQNGSIGAARGANSAYFFSNDASSEGILRLQGIFSNGVAGGNGGIALHPNHNLALGSNATTLAFVATVNRSIKIVDTFSFRERGEIQIRDNIVGQLRAALPIAGENTGLAECDQISVKLYGVTGAGKAVIINVRNKDIINPTTTAAVCPL